MSFVNSNQQHENASDEQPHDPLTAAIIEWALNEDDRDSRQILEDHLELVRLESEQILSFLFQQAAEHPFGDDLVSVLRPRLRIIHAVRARGPSRQAVREAFVDEYGAFQALDLPSWLTALLPELSISSGDRAVEMYQEALDRIGIAPNDPNWLPDVWATLRLGLARAMEQRGNEMDFVLATIVFGSVFGVFSRERFPMRWALATKEQSFAFLQWAKSENDPEIYGKAIAGLNLVLPSFPLDTYPEHWATIQSGLGSAYAGIKERGRAEMHLNAALRVFTQEDYPQQHTALKETIQELRAM